MLDRLSPKLTTTTTGDDQCILRLYSTGRSDVVAWYRIWEAVEATFAMCGRFLQGGSYRGLGWFSQIMMRVRGENCRLTCHLGQQGNVFLTLGARSPTVSTGNRSDDATA